MTPNVLSIVIPEFKLVVDDEVVVRMALGMASVLELLTKEVVLAVEEALLA